MTPEDYLLSKGFKPREAPGEWQLQCQWCGDRNKHGHLYVNREHGAFYCHRCGENGSFAVLQTKFGDVPEPASKDLAAKWDVFRALVEVAQDELVLNSDILEHLKDERGLTTATIMKYRLGWVGKDWVDQLLGRGFTAADLRNAGLMTDKNYPLFWDRIVIPYFERGQVVEVRAKQIGGNVLHTKDSSVRLFGADNLRGHKEVFVCEGEFDAMLLDQLGFPSCGLPGALSYQEHWGTWFAEARRIFTVLDADDAGRKGVAKVQAFLGKRVRVVELPVPEGEDSTDVTEFFLRDGFTVAEFRVLVDLVRGQRLYSLRDAMRERDEMLKLEGLKLGWSYLDEMVRPGFLPGQVITVLAKTGAGKTTLVTQACHNMSSWQPFDGESSGPSIPTMVLSLEQTKAEIATRLLRIGHMHNPWAETDEVVRWHNRLKICDENRMQGSDLRVLFDEFVEEVGMAPRLVVIDYLGYWARSFQAKSKYEQLSEAVMELKGMAKELGVVVLAPHQVNRTSRRGERIELEHSRDSGVIEETADFVFSLYRPHDRAPDEYEDAVVGTWEERAELRMEILKSRHGNTGRQVKLLWAPFSLAVVPQEGRLERRVKVEFEAYDRNMLYDDVLLVHRGEKWL